MKIAVAGKGGVGKTFIAATIADHLSRKGFRVLAVDADPSPSLAYILGIPESELQRIIPISDRDDLVKNKTDTGAPGVYRLSFKVDDIVRDYSIRIRDSLNLIVMGTVKSAGEGCTCPENALLRALMRHLVVQRDEIVILDMEAGLEHMGRGTAERVDLMLVVSEPGYRSLTTACRLIELAREAGVSHTSLIGNKIRDERDAKALKKYVSHCQTNLAALIPYDEIIQEFETEGLPPFQDGVRSKAISAIRSFTDIIVDNFNVTGLQDKTLAKSGNSVEL